jgi:hypothetical protein
MDVFDEFYGGTMTAQNREKGFKAPRIDPDRELIEQMIAWRRLNRPADDSPIRTSLDAKALHKALGVPLPINAEAPRMVLHLGYEIAAHG